MRFSNHSSIPFILLSIFMLFSCAGGESASTPATAAKPGATAEAAVDHRAPRDTVNWQAAGIDGQPPWSGEADREWPGEAMGLTGPIIAMGGSGSKTYVAIYDPGGVFIGALYVKEAREDPSRLENLVRLAHERGVIQNARAVEQAAARRYIALVQAASQGGAP